LVGRVKTLLLLLLLLLALLWNWDGFWQTQIGFLRSSQERYFPAKVALEQQKVRTSEEHTSEHEQLRAAVQALEALARQSSPEGEAKLRQYLAAALQIIDELSSQLSAEQLQAVRGACASPECEEIFAKGRALLD
jgi:hypothetical protein